MNKVIILSRISQDLELKTTQSGTSVLSFTVANDTGFGDNKQTNWIDCVAWGQQAEVIARNFTKGSRILLSGELQTRNWEDKNGNKRKSVEVIIREFDFIDKKSEQGMNDPLQTVADNLQGFESVSVADDDDLPF